MDRKYCSHEVEHFSVIIVQWCRRCSGWRVRRVGVPVGSTSAGCSVEVYESHFLPLEETTPDELQHFIQRAFRAEQEFPNDGEQAMLFDYLSHEQWLRVAGKSD